MKKVLTVLILSLVITAGLFAFDGSTSASFAYSYDGNHYLGISSESIGFFNNSNFGYYGSADALFNVKSINDWKIDMLVGPAYRYSFDESGVKVNIAVGASVAGTNDKFSFGIGSYVGADWSLTEHFGFTIGTKLGSNFVELPYNRNSLSVKGDFYVTPLIGVNFYY